MDDRAKKAYKQSKQIIDKMLIEMDAIDRDYLAQSIGAAISALVLVLMMQRSEAISLDEIEAIIIQNSIKNVRLAVEVAELMEDNE